jgi:hypothetical protein
MLLTNPALAVARLDQAELQTAMVLAEADEHGIVAIDEAELRARLIRCHHVLMVALAYVPATKSWVLLAVWCNRGSCASTHFR